MMTNNSSKETIEEKQHCLLEDISVQNDEHQRFDLCQKCAIDSPKSKFNQFNLRILNLSGCYRLTDSGLK